MALWCAFVAGLSSTLFLYAMTAATDTRLQYPWLLWGLPWAGLFIGYLFHRASDEVRDGTATILSEIHRPHKMISWIMAPLILLGTLLTHLFGGSAGREGTAVQMAAALADQATRVLNLTPEERKKILVMGAGAGFAGALGTPFAGVLFGMEFLSHRGLRLIAPVGCAIASFGAHGITRLLAAPHTQFPHIDVPIVDFWLWGAALISGMAFGTIAYLFVSITHFIESVFVRIPWPPLRPFVGGWVIIGFCFWVHTDKYLGLGIPWIQNAMIAPTFFNVPFIKMLFTAVTLAAGFKGGEFIPLVFIGATFGSALSAFIPIPLQMLSALGAAAVFGAASRTPWACAVMAIELFGWPMAPYAIVGCVTASFFSGTTSIYRNQSV